MFVFLSGKTVLSLHVWYSSTTKNKTIILIQQQNNLCYKYTLLHVYFPDTWNTWIHRKPLGTFEKHLKALEIHLKALEIHLKPSKPFETFEIHLKLKYTWNLRTTIWNYYGNEDPVAAFVHIPIIILPSYISVLHGHSCSMVVNFYVLFKV